MVKETKKLLEERAVLIAEQRQILDTAQEEERDLNADEKTKSDTILDDIETKNDDITRIERAYTLTSEKRELIEKKAEKEKTSTDEAKDKSEKVKEAFSNYLRMGPSKLSRTFPEQAELLEKNTAERAQSVGTDSEGGFLVPEDFSNELEAALKAFGGVRSVARVITTGTGADLPWPTVDSTGNLGEWLSENAAAAELDEVFASITLSAYMASSKIVRVSRQLMQDSFFNLDAYLTDALAERIGRLENIAFTTGSGVGQPTGVTHGAAIGITSASNTAITFDELKDVKFDLDIAYHRNATWMFNQSTLKAISQLKGQGNDYIWQPSTQVGEPDLILGHRFTVNNDMPSIAAGNRSLLFGDFKKYVIRDVSGFLLLRLEELYAANLQIGFLGFRRTEGKTIDAGQGPIRVLRQPTT